MNDKPNIFDLNIRGLVHEIEFRENHHQVLFKVVIISLFVSKIEIIFNFSKIILIFYDFNFLLKGLSTDNVIATFMKIFLK